MGLSFRVRYGTGRFPHAMTAVTITKHTNQSSWSCFPVSCKSHVFFGLRLLSRNRIVNANSIMIMPVKYCIYCVLKVIGLLVQVSYTSLQSLLPHPAYQPSGLAGGLSHHNGAWKSHLEAGFPLRCFQRLSLPNVANQRCTWQYN